LKHGIHNTAQRPELFCFWVASAEDDTDEFDGELDILSVYENVLCKYVPKHCFTKILIEDPDKPAVKDWWMKTMENISTHPGTFPVD
jgi:hypothetical protein